MQEAFAHPREIDWNLVDAQQTRRILDRLVGFQVSPLLWDKVRRGLSAGRVQTVALRLIVDREHEIQRFVPLEYWTLDAKLAAQLPPPFVAHLSGTNPKVNVLPMKRLQSYSTRSSKAAWTVRSVDLRDRRQMPLAPFTTSKFQQDASRKFGMTVKRVMMIAQRLYEGIELGDEGTVGLITYMRTDSVRVSDDAIASARKLIGSAYGKGYLPLEPNEYKKKQQNAQDAHEAIRPTDPERNPDSIRQHLQEDEFKVYKLIWQRFVASQMTAAVFDQTTVDIDATSRRSTSPHAYNFRVTGSVLKFEGFLKVYEESQGRQGRRGRVAQAQASAA